jgi:dihydrofolate reductase
VEEALEIAREDDEPFIGGGSQIYRIALARGLVNRLYVTRIHAELPGDTHFPEFDFDAWDLVSEAHHNADEKNEFDYTFEVWDKQQVRS